MIAQSGAFLALLLALQSPQTATNPSDAVVMILSDTTAGNAAYGSGFFISADGTLLTCYHVILDSTKIRVLTSTNWFESVTVESIAPDRDLAVLRVNGLAGPVPFLPTASDARWAGTDSFLVYGHPGVLADAKSEGFVARPTADGVVHSSVVRAPDTLAPLFARDLDLIPLEMLIHNGLSGAPVTSRGRVVGVLSGSINQGGSLAWAIPVKYVSGLTSVGQPASKVTWPRLTLMSPGWKNVRKEARAGLPLIAALDRFGTALDRLIGLNSATQTEMRALVDALTHTLQQMTDDEIKRHGSSYPVDKVEGFDAKLDSLSASLADKESQIGSGMDSAAPEVALALTSLRRELRSYFESLPQTPGNVARRDQTLSLVDKELSQSSNDANALDKALDSLGEKFSSLGDYETLGEFKKGIGDAAAIFGDILNLAQKGASDQPRVRRALLDLIDGLLSNGA